MKHTLYGFPGSANLVVHMILEELHLPFDFVTLDRSTNAHRTSEFLAMNPAGRVPVLIEDTADGKLVLSETAAIVLHLCDSHPEAALAPREGTAERARFYQHLMYLTNTMQAEAHPFFYPEEHTTDPDGVAAVKAATIARWNGMFALMDGVLGAGGPYLLGEPYLAIDPYLVMLVRWGRHLPRPAREWAHLRDHADRVLARPAIERALAGEGIGPPYLG